MDKESLILKVLNMLLDNKDTSDEVWQNESIFIWKYVILRCRNAWVHFGKLEYAKNWVYRLSESRRLWYWCIKDKKWVSLSELAIYWISNDSKVCELLELIEITEKEWAEIIPVKLWVEDTFKNIKVYLPN